LTYEALMVFILFFDVPWFTYHHVRSPYY
jgi:hypothetical protein